MMNMKLVAMALLSTGILVSCSDEPTTTATAPVSTEQKIVKRNIDLVKYSQGERLFQVNCAVCHGKQGEGAPNWRLPDENGKNLAPPLNGTGHTWHHSMKGLTSTIRNGTGKIGGNMPAWKGKLSKREITLILTWITAQWPDELYTAWYNRFHQK